jgi:hypothetical protein
MLRRLLYHRLLLKLLGHRHKSSILSLARLQFLLEFGDDLGWVELFGGVGAGGAGHEREVLHAAAIGGGQAELAT